jgi:hypothetical protein
MCFFIKPLEAMATIDQKSADITQKYFKWRVIVDFVMLAAAFCE